MWENSMNEKYMQVAIDEAKSAAMRRDYAIGACIVGPDGEIVAQGGNLVKQLGDSTCHAEFELMRRARSLLPHGAYLEGYTLVSTAEPCLMCTGASIWLKMSKIVFGTSQQQMLEYAKQYSNDVYKWRAVVISCEELIKRAGVNIEVVGGVMVEECKELYALSKIS